MLRICMHGRSTVEACAGVPGRRVMVSYQFRGGHANLMNIFFSQSAGAGAGGGRDPHVPTGAREQCGRALPQRQHCAQGPVAPAQQEGQARSGALPRKPPATSQITLLRALTHPLRCQRLAGPA